MPSYFTIRHFFLSNRRNNSCIKLHFTIKLQIAISAGRFSIGAIMFDRELWEDMGGFKRDRYLCDGRDEEEITSYCVLRSKAMVVAEDALVGHYCFGGFYTNMNKFMKDNKYRFLKEEE